MVEAFLDSPVKEAIEGFDVGDWWGGGPSGWGSWRRGGMVVDRHRLIVFIFVVMCGFFSQKCHQYRSKARYRQSKLDVCVFCFFGD